MPHTMFAASIAALLRDVFWKSLPVFALAGLASLALRRASAAKRHALWLLTLAALLCLPLFCALLPRWAAPVLPAAPHLAASAPKELIPREQARVVAPPAQMAPAPVVSDTVPPAMAEAALPPPPPAVTLPPVRSPAPARPVTAAQWVCLVWLVGALLLTGRPLLGLAAASRLTRRCRLVTAGPLAQAADAARQALGLTRPLSVRVGPVAVPMTCGVVRPVVLLPENATDWPAGRLRAVLLHEAAHVQRLDWATMLLARCVCALYWPHPLAWLAAHRLRVEAEGACDDRVLTCGVPAPDYAAHLLEIVRALSSRRASSVATVAMASRLEVSARLRTILDARQARHGVTRRGLALAALTALAILAPLAAMRPVASAPSRGGHHVEVSTGATDHNTSWQEQFSPPRLKSLMAQRSPWLTTLADGARVRLLSIGAQDVGGNVVSSWTPDGEAQWSSGPAATQEAVPGHLLFTYGIFVPPSLGQYEGQIGAGKFNDKDSATYGFPPLSENQCQSFSFPAVYAPGQTRGAVEASLVFGSGTVLIAADYRTGAAQRLATGEIVSVSPVREQMLQIGYPSRAMNIASAIVTLPTRFVHSFIEYGFDAIGQDGQPIRLQHGFSSGYPRVSKGTARLLYTWRAPELPRDKVKEFRFTYRPSYTAVFRNVVLRPAIAPASVLLNPQTESPEKARADRQASLANLRQIGLGLTMYAADHPTPYHEGHFPDAAHWMDEIIPYLVPRQITGAARQQRIAALLHDPAAPAGQTWSYAYNRALSGLPLGKVDFPASTVAVFESTEGTRNASDGGQSIPKPGWHTGGTDYLFTDGHVKFFLPSQGRPPFSPVDPNKPVAIPVTGRVYDRKTLKPVTNSSVIFSHSSQTITRGSVWPWSFTHSTGRFQCALYPGKNYLMVLEGGRYVPVSRQPMLYETSGGTARVTTMGPAAHQYIINLVMPSAYTLEGESHPDKAAGLDVMAFVPVSRATLKPVTGAAPPALTSAPATPTVPLPSASPAPQPAAQTKPDDRARFLAGLTAVQGPGVVVTLNDSRKPLPRSLRALPHGMAPPSLIHDTDINQVVSELKAAGAEAIAVNGERLVAVSPIRSAGVTIFVNSTALTPPYVVRAIGDIHTLQAALNLPRGVADQIRTFDPAMVKVQTAARLTLPAFRGDLPNHYARPVGAASGADALGQIGSTRTRAFTVSYLVPRQGVHHVRIVFTDVQGRHLAFSRLCPPGYSIDLPETAHGERVNFRVFDNERLVKQQTF